MKNATNRYVTDSRAVAATAHARFLFRKFIYPCLKQSIKFRRCCIVGFKDRVNGVCGELEIFFGIKLNAICLDKFFIKYP